VVLHRTGADEQLCADLRVGETISGEPSDVCLLGSQFFEFIGRIADSSTDGDTVRLAPVFVQPESADDVAAALADVAVSEPVNGIVELAGPEQLRLDELARRVLRATTTRVL
jgi:uncharacterized protein YbjT (DUF2867 family)